MSAPKYHAVPRLKKGALAVCGQRGPFRYLVDPPSSLEEVCPECLRDAEIRAPKSAARFSRHVLVRIAPEDNAVEPERPVNLVERCAPSFRQIAKELDRQHTLWGWPKPFRADLPTPENLRPALEQLEGIARENQRTASSFPDILVEEVAEALRAESVEELAEELAQTGAVIASWLQALRELEK